ALQMHLRIDALETGEELLVVGERQARMKAIDDVELGRRIVPAIFELLPRLFEAHGVRARHVLLELRERAKQAGGNAYVCHLEAHVPIEIRAVSVLALTYLVGQLTYREEIGLVKECDAVLKGESFPAQNLGPKGVKHVRPLRVSERDRSPRRIPNFGPHCV